MTISRKVKETSGLPPSVLRDQARLLDPYGDYSGYYGQQVIDAHPQINSTPSDEVVQGKNNQFIILGRDRPAGPETGYGGKGDTHAGSIDIIAGMSGIQARVYDPKTGKDLKTEKSPSQDAARIYISQKADIDDYFGLVAGEVGNSKTKSGIMVKADAVRIMGREGIKLVTMADRYASPGYEGMGAYGIDLIAGNDDRHLQPIPKGEYLVDCLTEVAERMCDLAGISLMLMNIQREIYEVVVGHTHAVNIPPLLVSPAPPTLSPAIGITKTGVTKTLLSDKLIADANPFVGQRFRDYAKGANQIKIFNDQVNDLYCNYLLPIPNQSYILSHFCNVT
jgi:hypothetical protein